MGLFDWARDRAARFLAPPPRVEALAAGAGGGAGDNGSKKDFPAPSRDLPLQILGRFKTQTDVEAVLQQLDLGYFQLASWLVEQMLWNPRLCGVLDTRLNGMMGTPIRWEPGRQNALGRRAAADIVEDWPLIADEGTRKQLHQWGIFLGAGFAQKAWWINPDSGRAIPSVRVWHPQWVTWNWAVRAYQVQTMDGVIWIPSPASTVPGQPWQPPAGWSAQAQAGNASQWIVHEPFGQNSWRWGRIRAASEAWLGHNFACRDESRVAEKLGVGLLTVEYPTGGNRENALKKLARALRKLGSESVIPLEQFPEEANGSEPVGIKVKPLEWTGNGASIIKTTKDSKAVDLAVLFLGHNLTTEAKGGSYAAANVGDLIRGDIKAFDAAQEQSTFFRQVLGDWAEANYGDRSVAPVAVYETDPPAMNLAAAQTLQFLAAAIGALRVAAPWVDFEALLARFRVPQKVGGAAAAGPLPALTPGEKAAVADFAREIEKVSTSGDPQLANDATLSLGQALVEIPGKDGE